VTKGQLGLDFYLALPSASIVDEWHPA